VERHEVRARIEGVGIIPAIRVSFAEDAAVLPGALTPSEIIMAWKTGADLIKVFPCAHVGGDSYTPALKALFPNLPLIASGGGVNQQSVFNFISGRHSCPWHLRGTGPEEPVQLRQEERSCRREGAPRTSNRMGKVLC